MRYRVMKEESSKRGGGAMDNTTLGGIKTTIIKETFCQFLLTRITLVYMSIQLLLTLHVGKQKIQLQTSNNKKEN
jgi:hypothetical protein